MVQATTPTFVLTLPNDVDLTEPNHFFFTAQQGNTVIQKSDEDLVIDGHTVSVYLTQEDTIKFLSGNIRIQLNWTYDDGSRAASEIATVRVTENLLKEVIEDE